MAAIWPVPARRADGREKIGSEETAPLVGAVFACAQRGNWIWASALPGLKSETGGTHGG